MLAALLILSVTQVGILWSGINTGFPFSRASGEASAQAGGAEPVGRAEALAEAAAVVLNPYRVTVCDGGQRTQQAHYPIARESRLFSTLIARCRTFLEELATVAPEAAEVPFERWGELVSERGILVEYKTAIGLDIISWLTERQNIVPGAPADVRKLLILPEDNAGRQAVCLYVLSSDRITRLFSQAVGSFDIQKLISDSVQAASAAGSASTETGTVGSANAETGIAGSAKIRYQTISEVGGGRFPLFAPDVFCVVEGPKTGAFNRLRYAAAAESRSRTELEDIILGDDIYSYNRALDYNGTLVFRNMTSVYRLYTNGFMEYGYIPLTQPAEKGALTDALEKALGYVLNIERQFAGGGDLILSGIYRDESELTYRFTFDYMLGDYPVHFRYTHTQGDTTAVYGNAITVLANANRTVSCRRMLVGLSFAPETRNLQIYFDRIEVGQSLTRMAVSDIAIAYLVDLGTGGANAAGNAEAGGAETGGWPVWAVTTPDGVSQTVGMTETG